MVRSRCWTLGLNTKFVSAWSDAEVAMLRSAYARAIDSPVNLMRLAKLLGRNRHNVCRKARALGLTNPKRKKAAQAKISFKLKAGSPELSALASANAKRSIAKYGHPRGALGMKHTPEAKALMAKAHRRAWADPASKFNTPEHRQRMSDVMLARIASGKMRSGFTRCSGGRRADIGDMYFRSSWEANYARYLNFMKARGDIENWEYEPKVFVFETIKRGNRAYTPDFKITMRSGAHEWHEVKGWMDPASKTRLSRMAKFFPEEKVVVIGEEWFKQARRGGLAALLPGWENNGRRNK